jgi:cytochrome P450
VLATISLVAVAGQATTRDLIAGGLSLLLGEPESLARLARSPEAMDLAIRELLRYVSPAQSLGRRAARDLVLDGQTIRKGEPMRLMLGLANRDPDEFPDAERLDLTRSPNPHLALGHGPHFCVGAGLGRLEVEVAFRAVAGRLPGLRLHAPPVWARGEVRAPRELWVTY